VSPLSVRSHGEQSPLTFFSSFYKQLGFGNNSFMYTNISSAAVVAVTIPCLLLYDRIGRRPIMIVGSFLMIPGLLIVAILGSKSTHSSSEVGAIVFSVILYSCAVKVAFSTPCYMVASEIGGVMMRKKSEWGRFPRQELKADNDLTVMTFAACWDVISAFVNNYSVPYLLNKPGAGLGAKVGYIFAAISICAFFFTVFFVPELKGRSLEEVDELFEL
jgi:SP family sugar:H+ symporter-like MFS transporter